MIYDKLYDYQKEIINGLYTSKSDCRNNLGTMLFMDMGCGKTITSLALCEKLILAHQSETHVTVFCLACKKRDWQGELNHYFYSNTLFDLTHQTDAKIANTKSSIFSFESITEAKFAELLGEFKSNVKTNKNNIIILDESHKTKNTGTIRQKFFNSLYALLEQNKSKQSYNFICLTGTPEHKGYIDLYMPLKLCNMLPQEYTLISYFKRHFCVYAEEHGHGHSFLKLVGYKNQNELKNILDNKHVVNFKMENKDKPYTIAEKVVNLKNEYIIDAEYTLVRDKVLYKDTIPELRLDKDIVCENISSLRHTLRRLDAYVQYFGNENTKIHALSKILVWAKKNNKKSLVIYSYNQELDNILKMCSTLRINSQTYNSKNHDITNAADCYVCQVKAVSHGLNVFADWGVCVGVYYSLPDSYIDYTQSFKRLDRIGQKNDVVWYKLVYQNTVDTQILEKIENHEDYSNKDFDLYVQRKSNKLTEFTAEMWKKNIEKKNTNKC